MAKIYPDKLKINITGGIKDMKAIYYPQRQTFAVNEKKKKQAKG